MNLYLRLLWTLMRSWRLPAIRFGDVIERRLRVLPNDLDVNGHMNNGRYLTLVDLMLVETFVRSGFAQVMLRHGWRPMAGGSFITYRRGLQPLQAYSMRCRFTAGDSRWNYLHFEFLRGDVVCAAGYVKGAVVGREGWVPNLTSHAALGLPPPEGDLPAAVRHWLAAERDVLAHAG